MFDHESYAFQVSEEASTGDAVGTVPATDPNGDAVTYSITEDNEDGTFDMDRSTRGKTVAGGLDHLQAPT